MKIENGYYGFVYITTNKVNGMKYIGAHRCGFKNDTYYLGSGHAFREAVKEFGRDKFERKILGFYKTPEELRLMERYWISYFKAPINPEFYNIADGGNSHKEYYHQSITENMLDALERGRHLPASEKQKQVLRENRKQYRGSKYMNKDGFGKQVKKDEIEKYLNDGWVFGRIPKK